MKVQRAQGRRFARAPLVGIGVLALVCGCSAPAAERPEDSQMAAELPAVPVGEIKTYPWPQTLRVQGSLIGEEVAVVGTRVAGLVDQVRVDMGSLVAQGDPLVLLDARELRLRAEQAEAQLAQACAAIGLVPQDSEDALDRELAPPVVLERAMLEEARAHVQRGETLLARQAITNEEFERLVTRVTTAEARYATALNGVNEQIALVRLRRTELALARQHEADAAVLAPFDAVVRERHAAPGEYLSVGQAVATLVRTDSLRFAAGIPERAASLIREGLALLVRIEGEPEPFECHISRVSPALDLSSRSLTIEADLPNPDRRLRSGLFAEAEIVVNPEASTLAVPLAAVSEFAGVEKVWLVENGEARERPVRTGRRVNGMVEIVSGLEPGDTVITDCDMGHAGQVYALADDACPLESATAALP